MNRPEVDIKWMPAKDCDHLYGEYLAYWSESGAMLNAFRAHPSGNWTVRFPAGRYNTGWDLAVPNPDFICTTVKLPHHEAPNAYGERS